MLPTRYDCGIAAGQSERCCEMKCAAPARHTFDPDSSAHQIHQAAGICQAETYAAVLSSRGAISLGERFENHRLLVIRDANPAILNAKMQLNAFRRNLLRLAIYDDLALLGELDRIPDKIYQDLAKPHGISHQELGDVCRGMPT